MKSFAKSQKQLLTTVSKRGLFSYSKTEYIANAKNCLTSSQRKVKTLNFEKADSSNT